MEGEDCEPTPLADALKGLTVRVRELERLRPRLTADRNTLLQLVQALWRRRDEIPADLTAMIEAAYADVTA